MKKYSPTLAAVSVKMLLTKAVAKDGNMRHFDAEQTFLKADIDEGVNIEIPKECEEFPGAVALLNKANLL